MKKKINITLATTKRHGINPFIVELQGRMYIHPRANSVISSGEVIMDTTTGEIKEKGVLVGRVKYVDKSQFAKIYASEVGLLYELSKTAQTVFFHFTKIMDYDNKVVFSYKHQFKDVNYKSHVPVLNGLKELIHHNIIAAHLVRDIYWLNPVIVCKGERFLKFTQYIVGKNNEAINQEDVAKHQIAEQTKELLPNNINTKQLFDSQNKDPYEGKKK